MLSYHGSMRPRNAANSPSSECLDAADVCEQGVGAEGQAHSGTFFLLGGGWGERVPRYLS